MGWHCCLLCVSYSLVPMEQVMLVLFWWRVSSVACEASLMVVEMAFSLVRGGRLSRWRFVMVLAKRSMRSVGSFSGLDSSASDGQWLNWVRGLYVWEYAR